ncbi:FecR family protein [Mucilaginibacter paludis]|uniref:Anti-FecI sigma factor, FecR n=1 Tax=Mucilaginibacter paludis DSM 18603 TaxID=714943 RepID=H1YA45_9SPHI|nr:FecR family protein [Mucilaginibacter paludis]EHQ25926.1 anti-FecI sigma factor, FecR [Mucilaginibacter paludis DSM 18603]
MALQDDTLKQLAEKYKAGLCTADEIEQIRAWYDDFEANGYPLPPADEIDRASMEAAAKVIRLVAEQQSSRAAAVGPVDEEALNTPVRKINSQVMRYAAAAAVLIFSAIGTYFYLKPAQQQHVLSQAAKKDFTPGGNKAVLTLSNGTTIVLNNARNGNLAQQGFTAVHKKSNGLLAYQVNPGDHQAGVVAPSGFNTITTPRGGQYQVILPDGTKVWLNSVSSIRFPVAFNGNSRQVETTGEVYFEVAKDKQKPFMVSSGGQMVTVLGTHFNIMAYADEYHIVTTLLEGSVKISKGNLSRIIKPGEQALVDEGITVSDADTNDAVAWKNGVTSFNEADIKTIMRKVSRWYDVDVEYQGPVSNRLFTGAISRQSNLSGLLKILALNHIQFSMDGNKLIVK